MCLDDCMLGLGSYLSGKNCSFGKPYVHFVLCIFVILVLSHFSSESGTVVLNDPVPG